VTRRLSESDVYHDVPSDEPAVIAAYVRYLSHLHGEAVPAILNAVNLAGARPWQALSGAARARYPRRLFGAWIRYL
jgi:hypothetical protein